MTGSMLCQVKSKGYELICFSCFDKVSPPLGLLLSNNELRYIVLREAGNGKHETILLIIFL